MSTIEQAIAAIGAGEPVIIPTDTVYGLVARADEAAPTERLYDLKGREARQPSALMAADVETLLAWLPECQPRDEAVIRTLLPGLYTLVLPNPAERYPWLGGARPDTIGVRVPSLPTAAARVVASVGAVVSTSANEPGGPDARTVTEIPASLQEGAGAVVDGGTLPGAPSTVLDFTGTEPRVLREGAAPSVDALRRVADALR